MSVAAARNDAEMATERKPVVETLVVLARHGSTCGGRRGCHGHIFPDEPIQRVDGYWLHEECVPFDAVQQVTVRHV